MLGMTAVFAAMLFPAAGWAQETKTAAPLDVSQPDAQHTREELSTLLDHYPPSMREVLALDPTLLGNQDWMAPYPALVAFLHAHPEIARNPSFYVGEADPRLRDPGARSIQIWNDLLTDLAAFAGFGMGIALLIWLIRTLVDYRRWSRLARVQTEVHTKLLDRFTANEDLLAYIHSPAGSKFLESSPIALDAAPRSMGAPLGRILWSVQGGVVLIAGGIGLELASRHVAAPGSEPLHMSGNPRHSAGSGLRALRDNLVCDLTTARPDRGRSPGRREPSGRRCDFPTMSRYVS